MENNNDQSETKKEIEKKFQNSNKSQNISNSNGILLVGGNVFVFAILAIVLNDPN